MPKGPAATALRVNGGGRECKIPKLTIKNPGTSSFQDLVWTKESTYLFDIQNGARQLALGKRAPSPVIVPVILFT